jgi:large subunit ribosomal protein L10
MDNPRPEKVAVVTEVREHFEQANAAILTEYRGLTVKDMAGLRRTLRDAGSEYKIYKNTLVRFAARDLGLELEELLTGPTAIAFVGGDAAAVAKALRDYARTNPKLVVKGGVLGNKIMTVADAAALADLPPRDVVLSRLAGALAAPMQTFAGLLQALPRNFAYGLKALLEKRGGVESAEGVDAAGTTEDVDSADAAAPPAPADEAPAPAPAEPQAAAAAEPEAAADPAATAEPEAAADPAATAEPEAAADPAATAEPDAAADPAATAEPEAAADPAATAEPEAAAAESEPADDDATGTEPADAVVAEPDPIGPLKAETVPGEPEADPPQAGPEPTEVLADHGISAAVEPQILSVQPSPASPEPAKPHTPPAS